MKEALKCKLYLTISCVILHCNKSQKGLTFTVHIVVAIKRTLDYRLVARPNVAGTAVELAGQRQSLNPFDEIAVEAALQLKAQGVVTKISVVSIGEATAAEGLRHALAMGADVAYHGLCTGGVESLPLAQALVGLMQPLAPDLILMGKQAIDTDAGVVPHMVAELLGWPLADQAYKIALQAQGLDVVTETSQGLQTHQLPLPAVVTTDLRLQTPRLVTMPQIIQARAKPLQTITIAPVRAVLPRLKVQTPVVARRREVVPDVAALCQKLAEVRG